MPAACCHAQFLTQKNLKEILHSFLLHNGAAAYVLQEEGKKRGKSVSGLKFHGEV